MRHASVSESLSGLESLARIWRRRRLFATVFFGTIALTVVALLVLPVRYLATASVIVAEQEPGVANASPAWAQCSEETRSFQVGIRLPSGQPW